MPCCFYDESVFVKLLGKTIKNSNEVIGPSSYYKKENESNDAFMYFEEVSNMQNSDRSSNAFQSNVLCRNL